jgi:RNA polymerase sigma factor (TIGR02999 family)
LVPLSNAESGDELGNAIEQAGESWDIRRAVVAGAAQDVTRLLQAWSLGDETALDRLIPLVEAELRRLAGAYIRRERQGHTLQATELVNEAFLRLVGARHVQWQDRAHFVGIAARLMRQVLVDHARSRGSQKHGGAAERIPIDEARLEAAEPMLDLVDLNRALDAFSSIDGRRSQIVELRYFGGLTLEETAEVLHVSVETVKRDWRLAKLWLLRELNGDKHLSQPERRR